MDQILRDEFKNLFVTKPEREILSHKIDYALEVRKRFYIIFSQGLDIAAGFKGIDQQQSYLRIFMCYHL